MLYLIITKELKKENCILLCRYSFTTDNVIRWIKRLEKNMMMIIITIIITIKT
jgi:hypothetical protein